MTKIKVLKNILDANDQIAERNRQVFKDHKIMAINLMSSPGSGKTSLLLKTIKDLKTKIIIAVIEGDIASNIDAQKIAREKVKVIQINTGGACSLDASMISNGLQSFDLADIDILFIENVGNLVCPANIRLGETKKVMILSVPEGDDKPYKYPVMFTEADAILINKIDLLSLSDFDTGKVTKVIKNLNPEAPLFKISCKNGDGIAEWESWLLSELKKVQSE